MTILKEARYILTYLVAAYVGIAAIFFHLPRGIVIASLGIACLTGLDREQHIQHLERTDATA